jgi:hypothetical protein
MLFEGEASIERASEPSLLTFIASLPHCGHLLGECRMHNLDASSRSLPCMGIRSRMVFCWLERTLVIGGYIAVHTDVTGLQYSALCAAHIPASITAWNTCLRSSKFVGTSFLPIGPATRTCMRLAVCTFRDGEADTAGVSFGTVKSHCTSEKVVRQTRNPDRGAILHSTTDRDRALNNLGIVVSSNDVQHSHQLITRPAKAELSPSTRFAVGKNSGLAAEREWWSCAVPLIPNERLFPHLMI